MMREIIYNLPGQISEAIKCVPKESFGKKKYDAVLICGMGGSGISGEILSALYPEVMIISNKDYSIPKFTGRRMLAILVSYSGNTEETLSNFQQLSRRKIDTVVISSNGKLLRKKAFTKIQVPGGLPPRGALGYLFTPLPLIIWRAGLVTGDPRKKLVSLPKFLMRERDVIEEEAKRMAVKFCDKLPVFYVDSAAFVPVANRWRCQFNENAKVLAHFNVIPEMNHNEIVGLGRPSFLNKDMTIVFLSDPRAHQRNSLRRRLMKSLVSNEIPEIIDVEPRGSNTLESMFWTIMLGDFISYYLAIEQGVDPMPVVRIEQLKKEMAKHK